MKTRYLPLLVLLAAGAPGCIKNNMSVEPAGLCAFPDDASKCILPAKCDVILTNRDVFVYTRNSLGINNALLLWLQYFNQLPNNADASAGRVNSNDATLEAYELTFDAPGLLIASRKIEHLNQLIPAEGATAAQVHVVPAETMLELETAMTNAALATVLMNVHIRATGHYANGSSFETGEFTTPVTVVNGTFPGFGCFKATDVVSAICPNDGQTATVKCEAP
jgi:hypothetical protein